MPKTTHHARSLRSNSTDAEKLLWEQLRKRQLDGIKFRRQYPVAPYIVDFASVEKMLIIELDGSQHASRHEYDQARDRYLQSQGFRIVRYWNNQIFSDMDAILAEIRSFLHSPP